jgi:hypothetical protein
VGRNVCMKNGISVAVGAAIGLVMTLLWEVQAKACYTPFPC